MNESITVVGNVASVPERRELPNGGAVTSFRLASTERRFDRNTSTWTDGRTNYFTVNAFRGLGENAHRSLHKGERVVVAGRFRLREWETDAKKGVTAEIEADAVGHDLLWGTSVFRKGMPSPAAPQIGDTHPIADAPPADGPDAWAAPGAPRELVPSGDTPF
ncbi:single-stranded DNA-binding protein [Microbacterium sp. 18062]|uniref:single-stranded DNA-binding protein n=1 Tax=Microbacterium sp. 18062 TaxID=2681410 RepID=UPI0013579E8C|nr:single-stranded DNA-binding protein [Microbacterium sp. 18062]